MKLKKFKDIEPGEWFYWKKEAAIFMKTLRPHKTPISYPNCVVISGIGKGSLYDCKNPESEFLVISKFLIRAAYKKLMEIIMMELEVQEAIEAKVIPEVMIRALKSKNDS